MPRRVPVITREQVADEHKAAYDEISAIRGRPPVVGPSSVLVNSPEMALRSNRLSEYLGGSKALPEKIKRLAGMIAARSMDCQYISSSIARWSLYTTPVEWTSSDFVNGVL